MDEKGEEDLLKMLAAQSAKQILEFLNQHGLCQYKQLEEFMNTYTLNIRLREMLIFGLVQFSFDRIETKERGYEITEKGKKVLQIAEDIKKLVEDINREDVRQLLHFKFITHYFVKEGVIKRKEWYELTEKGKKVLKIAEAIIQVVDRG